VRAAAVHALGHVLPPTRESEAAATKAMSDPDRTVSRMAIKTARGMFQKDPQPENPAPQ
jgi:hypothetical protein